jgi:hypothetical protein
MRVSRVLILALPAGVLVWGGAALGQGLIIYPERGQSPQQQQQDQAQCHAWAVQQSGFDPARQQMAMPMPPPSGVPQGQVLRGAGRGAAVGAVGGAIGGDAGKGAAIGAATGALFGAMRRRDDMAAQQRQYEQAVNQQQMAMAQGSSTYNRALGACMAGRGYTVR